MPPQWRWMMRANGLFLLVAVGCMTFFGHAADAQNKTVDSTAAAVAELDTVEPSA
jgi:hypothetical protein